MNDHYTQATSLTQAIRICHSDLERAGKPELIPLVSQRAVRAAISRALRDYENGLKYKDASDIKQQVRQFRDVVAPIYRDIVDEDHWPRGAVFVARTSASDPAPDVYESFLLRLEIQTPGSYYQGFGLPILDIYFGHFVPAREDGLEDEHAAMVAKTRADAQTAWEKKDTLLACLLYEEIELELTPEEQRRLNAARKNL